MLESEAAIGDNLKGVRTTQTISTTVLHNLDRDTDFPGTRGG